MILEVGNVGGNTVGNILYFDIGNAGVGNAIGNIVGMPLGTPLGTSPRVLSATLREVHPTL
jgi:hypothetical protein